MARSTLLVMLIQDIKYILYGVKDTLYKSMKISEQTRIPESDRDTYALRIIDI